MEAKHFCELFRTIEETGGKQVKQWLESGPGVLIRFDNVKVSSSRLMCKPTYRWFQYHQSSLSSPEDLVISRFT